MSTVLDNEQLRIVARVARLYYSYGIKQTRIAQDLGISQARVSRLLATADDLEVVRTIVVTPRGLYPELETQLEEKFGLLQVHVVEGIGDGTQEPFENLGKAAAVMLESMPLEEKNIGFTAWARSLREAAKNMTKSSKFNSSHVIELLGDVGSPLVQHEGTLATEVFAKAIGATTNFLRLPSVVSSQQLAQSLVRNDSHASLALGLMNELDIALLGIGSSDIATPQYAGANFFTADQLRLPISKGAVGQVNLRFIDANGKQIETELDELVIGITPHQIKKTHLRVGSAAGASKWVAIKAAILGGWINVLVTDKPTAEYLLKN